MFITTQKLDGSTYLIFEKLINKLISYSEHPCYFNSTLSKLFQNLSDENIQLTTYHYDKGLNFNSFSEGRIKAAFLDLPSVDIPSLKRKLTNILNIHLIFLQECKTVRLTDPHQAAQIHETNVSKTSLRSHLRSQKSAIEICFNSV